MAEADEKLVAAAAAAQGRREQPYVECEGRRPPYFGEREPVAWGAEARFEPNPGMIADADQTATVKISGTPPSGEKWLKAEAERMKASPDCPYQITQAAQQLKSSMREAFLRRQCAEEWSAGGIKNKLPEWNLWPPRRRPRHPR